MAYERTEELEVLAVETLNNAVLRVLPLLCL
jgi:hypothetical protein